jgi:CHASE2 domain-containing sensor protein
MFEASRLFISYRRSDAQASARALCEALRARFGAERVFFDTSDIPYGEDFAQVVRERIAASDVVIAVIGPHWLRAANRDGRRLDRADDPVRFELSTALQLRKRIVPLRIDGAAAPAAADLPEPLRPLALLNMPELRGASFDIDFDELVRQLLGQPRPDLGFATRLKAAAKGGPLAATLLVAAALAANWTGLFDLLGLETRAQRLLLSAGVLGDDVPATVLLVRIDADSERALGRDLSTANAAAWRRDHARLIDRAAQAGAAAIAFDLFFESPTDADVVLADAAARARQRTPAMRVVFGVRAARDGVPALVPALRDAATWASLCLTDRGGGALWSAPLAVLRPARGAGGELVAADTPALALAALVHEPLRSADLARRELLFDGPPRNPPLRFSSVERQRVAPPACGSSQAGDDLALLRLRLASEGYWRDAARTVPYARALDAQATPDERFRGHTVLVGVGALQRSGAAADVFVVQDGLRARTVFGVELHADTIRTLASGRVPQLPTVDRQLATSLLACVLGGAVAVWGFERSALRRRLVLAAIALALLAGAWWLARHDVLLNVVGDLLTLSLAAVALRALQVMAARWQAFRRIAR